MIPLTPRTGCRTEMLFIGQISHALTNWNSTVLQLYIVYHYYSLLGNNCFLKSERFN